MSVTQNFVRTEHLYTSSQEVVAGGAYVHMHTNGGEPIMCIRTELCTACTASLIEPDSRRGTPKLEYLEVVRMIGVGGVHLSSGRGATE
jgi:hypothetical protein